MAAKGSGESRTGLVVFLVLFILLSISLGITTYLGYSEIDKEKKNTADAEKKAKDWTTDANYWKFLAMTYRSYLGLPPTKDDPKTLVELRRQYEGNQLNGRDDFKDDHRKTITEFWSEKNPNPGRKWDPATGRPGETYQDEINRLNKQLAAATKSAEEAKTAEEKANSTVKAKEDELEAAKKDFANNLQKQKTDDQAQIDGLRAQVTKLQQERDDLGNKALAGLKQPLDELTSLRKERDSLKKQLKDAVAVIDRTREQLARTQAAEDIDVTKIAPENLAKIVSVGGSGDMPYINIGSADNLKRLVTFSIFGKGVDGRPLKEPKGKLEVIRITGEHTAQARITELRDERRDPVLPGDFIYNPGWNPNLKQHVAVIGYIDLTGEGRNNMEEFIRTLKNQNLEVDAWMDMQSLKMNGEITRQTDMLIVGAGPDFGVGPIRGNDPKADAKSKVLEEMQKQQDLAAKNGVRVVRLNLYLELSGYPLPKRVGVDQSKIQFHKNLDAAGSPIERKEKPK
jgi:hypothetical protein